MSRRFSTLVIASVFTVGGGNSLAAPDGGVVTVRPTPSDAPVLNPGKGWVLYGRPDDKSAQALALGAVGYRRFGWAEIEPREGQFDFKPIDDFIAAWARASKKCAFGVMAANSHSSEPFVTPKWVFDAGAKYERKDLQKLGHPYAGTPGEKVVPFFDDPVFLAKLQPFVAAFGKRYDGNPHIAFIDIRSYGNWGEGHEYPFRQSKISPAVLRKHIEFYLDAFNQTLLCLPWGVPRYNRVYDWAVTQGIAMRRDGICGNSDGGETLRALGYAPGVFEWFGSYQFLKEKGWWDGKTKNGHGYRLSDCVENGKPTYVALADWNPQPFVDSEIPLIKKLTNRMGYHFVLTEARYPSHLKLGRPSSLSLTWQNRGVAPVYVPCVVAVAVLNDQGRPVEVCWPRQCDPPSWLGDKVVHEEATVSFAHAAPGSYRLAVGLCHYVGDQELAFRLGIDAQEVNGWYVLGPARLQAAAPSP